MSFLGSQIIFQKRVQAGSPIRSLDSSLERRSALGKFDRAFVHDIDIALKFIYFILNVSMLYLLLKVFLKLHFFFLFFFTFICIVSLLVLR